MRLLTVGNPKTLRGEAQGYLTGILHLAPHEAAGAGNVCPWASPGCIAACLNTAGRGGIFAKGASTNVIQEARKERTRRFFADRAEFVADLVHDVRELAGKARRHGLLPALRLNGTSDLPWRKLAPAVFHAAHERGVTVYDYTKSTERALAFLGSREWHVTLSRSERMSDPALRRALDAGLNVAVVFAADADRAAIARARWDADVVDGDATDLRFLDPSGPRGVVVGLKATGRARNDETGFVVR